METKAKRAKWSGDDILKRVIEYTGVKRDQITSKSRQMDIVLAKKLYAIMYYLENSGKDISNRSVCTDIAFTLKVDIATVYFYLRVRDHHSIKEHLKNVYVYKNNTRVPITDEGILLKVNNLFSIDVTVPKQKGIKLPREVYIKMYQRKYEACISRTQMLHNISSTFGICTTISNYYLKKEITERVQHICTILGSFGKTHIDILDCLQFYLRSTCRDNFIKYLVQCKR